MPMKLYTEEEFQAEELAKLVYEGMLKDVLDSYRLQDARRYEKTCESGSDAEKDRYTFIPMDIDAAYKQLRFVWKYCEEHKIRCPKFIDAGAGIGWIVRMAYRLGFQASGVELIAENVKVAETIFGVRVQCGDIRDIDYSKFDVVYYYCPINANEIQAKFERKVEKEMKPGAILIANMKQDRAIYKDKRFVRLTERHQIWRKREVKK